MNVQITKDDFLRILSREISKRSGRELVVRGLTVSGGYVDLAVVHSEYYRAELQKLIDSIPTTDAEVKQFEKEHPPENWDEVPESLKKW